MNTQTQTYMELDAFIINQLPTGSTFGVDDNTQEQVFIPSSLARQHNIVPGEVVRVRAIPNRKEGGARWFGIYIDRAVPAQSVEITTVTPTTTTTTTAKLPDFITEPDAVDTAESTEQGPDWYALCMDALKKLGRAATSKEIGEHVGASTQFASFYLRGLHKRGKICRASVRSSGTQEKDSYVFWALNTNDLFPATFDNG